MNDAATPGTTGNTPGSGNGGDDHADVSTPEAEASELAAADQAQAAREQADSEARAARHPGSLNDPEDSPGPVEPEPAEDVDAERDAALKPFATGEWDDANLDDRKTLSASLSNVGGGTFVRDYENGTADERAQLRATARQVIGLEDDDK